MSKMIGNKDNKHLFLRLYINSNDDCCCEIYFRNNGMYLSVIRMVMRKRKRMRNKKIITRIDICARMNIVFIFLVIDKTDRYEFILIIYFLILILYIILDGIYQLICQFMIESKGKHSNILQENVIYIEKNIFKKNVIYLVPRSVLNYAIIFS